MIQIQNLTYSYNRKKTLFRGLDIELPTGKIYGLLGRNGAGKSSLIKNIAGLLLPTSGSCVVFGHRPEERSPSFLQQMFFLPEDSDLPHILIHDLVKVYAPFYPNFNTSLFYASLQRFVVDKDAHISRLSYGQKKKVFISFSLAVQARILIMDEPTNGLDIPSKLTFRNLVSEARDANNIILISTHQVKDLDGVIDSVIVLDDSQILLYCDRGKIEERLQFNKASVIQQSNTILYQHQIPAGYTIVEKRNDGEKTTVDFEVLFNACLENPQPIAQSLM